MKWIVPGIIAGSYLVFNEMTFVHYALVNSSEEKKKLIAYGF